MKVTFIYHSCFIVEMQDNILLFDWFKGELPNLNREKQIYVFSSHKHHDHFNMDIFRKLEMYPHVHYVFSKDIRLSPNFLDRHGIDSSIRDSITFVGKNQEYVIGENENRLIVSTLTSTDTGVAFVIECEGKKVYHAGDLNWWSWPGEEYEAESQMEQGYIREIDKLKNTHLDVAFVVLDPRQEERYWWGLDYFMKVVEADIVFPMHCWERYEVISWLKKENCAVEYIDRIMTITEENQAFQI